MRRPLGSSARSLHRAELLEHLDHAQELLPVGAAERLEPLAALAPGAPPAARSPRQARSQGGVAPHGHRWHSIAASAASGPWVRSRSSSSGTVQAAELLGQRAQPAAVVPAVPVHVAGHVQRRRGPEDALDHAALEPHHRAVGQQRVERARGGRGSRARAGSAARLGAPLRRTSASRPGSASTGVALAAPPAAAGRLPPRLHLVAGAPIAADAREVAAGRRVLRGPRRAPAPAPCTSDSISRMRLRFWYWPNEDSMRLRMTSGAAPGADHAPPPSRSRA